MGTCQENGPLAEKTTLSRKSNCTGRKKERGEEKEIEDVPWDCRQGGNNRHLQPAFLLSRLLSGKKGRARMMRGQVSWRGSVQVIINGWHFRLFRMGDPLSQFFDSQSVTYCPGNGGMEMEMDGWSLQQRIPWHFQTIDLWGSVMNLCHFHGWIGISVSGLVGFFVCVFLFASLSLMTTVLSCVSTLLGLFVDLDWLGWS